MHIRSPNIPDTPEDRISPGPIDEVSFTVPRGVMMAKFALAAVLAMATVLATSGLESLVGLLAMAAVAAYAARDLIAQERLRADADGVVAVRGYAARRRLAWSEIERVRVQSRMRLGTRTELLELDCGEEIFLFSRFDLGMAPDDAAAALGAVRRP